MKKSHKRQDVNKSVANTPLITNAMNFIANFVRIFGICKAFDGNNPSTVLIKHHLTISLPLNHN